MNGQSNHEGEKPYEELIVAIEKEVEWTKGIIKKAIDEGNDHERDRLIYFSDRLKGFKQEIRQFQEPGDTPPPSTDLFYCRKGNLIAIGTLANSGFIVKKGSQVAIKETRTCPESYLVERKNLLKRGILVAESGNLVFSQDYEFSSPSRASSVVRGASSSGMSDWKDSNGTPLKNILPRNRYSL